MWKICYYKGNELERVEYLVDEDEVVEDEEDEVVPLETEV